MGQPPQVDLDPAQLLATPPADGYWLLELKLGWDDLDPAQERIAANLRSFVVTRDPLAWIPGRGDAWATANADGDTLELVVYVALDAVRGALAEDASVAAPARSMCRGRRPRRRRRRRPPRVRRSTLAGRRRPDATAAGRARRRRHARDPVRARASRGLGVARTRRDPGTLVQDAFGPVDFDRLPVHLGLVEPSVADCAACRGVRFGFPGDLETARPLLCSPHRAAALAVTAQRVTRARESNPAGWRALGKVSAEIHGLPEPGGMPLPARTGRSAASRQPAPVRLRPQVQALLRRLISSGAAFGSPQPPAQARGPRHRARHGDPDGLLGAGEDQALARAGDRRVEQLAREDAATSGRAAGRRRRRTASPGSCGRSSRRRCRPRPAARG